VAIDLVNREKRPSIRRAFTAALLAEGRANQIKYFLALCNIAAGTKRSVNPGVVAVCGDARCPR